MAIKINNKDMSRRVYNSEDVQRVILNGSQIRPTEIPHIDYHIIGDFDGEMPGGWSGDVTIGDRGITNGTAVWDGLPSLANARLVRIVCKFHWDGRNLSRLPLTNFIVTPSEDPYYGGALTYRTTEYAGELRTYDYWNGNLSWNMTTAGVYYLETIINLEDKVSQVALSDDGEVFDMTVRRAISDEFVSKIRRATKFQMDILDNIIVKKVDFYIYNN